MRPLASLFLAFLAATSSVTQSAQNSTVADGICDGVYYNGELHFSYTYPAKWHVLTEKQRATIAERGHQARPEHGPAVEAEHQASVKITRFDFEAAAKPRPGPGTPSVSIATLDISSVSPPPTPRQLLAALESEMRHSVPWYRSLRLMSIQIGETEFIERRFVVAPNANNLLFKIFADNYAAVWGNHIVMFSFMASTEDELSKIAATLQTFHKDDMPSKCDQR